MLLFNGVSFLIPSFRPNDCVLIAHRNVRRGIYLAQGHSRNTVGAHIIPPGNWTIQIRSSKLKFPMCSLGLRISLIRINYRISAGTLDTVIYHTQQVLVVTKNRLSYKMIGHTPRIQLLRNRIYEETGIVIHVQQLGRKQRKIPPSANAKSPNQIDSRNAYRRIPIKVGYIPPPRNILFLIRPLHF